MCIVEARRALRTALEAWGNGMVSSICHVWVDNMGLHDLLGGGKLKRSAELQEELVQILMVCLKFQLSIVPHWFCSEDNEIADAASRVHEPGSEAVHAAKLAALVKRWRGEHVPWVWRRRRAPPSDAGQLLEIWRASALSAASG
jgi:hypothetical protein